MTEVISFDNGTCETVLHQSADVGVKSTVVKLARLSCLVAIDVMTETAKFTNVHNADS